MNDEPRGDARPDGDRIGEATVSRFIDHGADIIVVQADFSRLFTAYLEHLRRWESATDGLTEVFMRQGLGAAALHLSCRPRGEVAGWTVNIQDPPTNIFITGSTVECSVTGRVFTEHVKTTHTSRMFVQVSRPGEQPAQSTIEVTGLDVLDIFEQYYGRSEQKPARFYEITDTRYMMILGLPDVDRGWLLEFTRPEAMQLDVGRLKPLGQTVYRFQCGCNPQLMLQVVVDLYRQQAEDLFRGDASVEILCPRCGRRWLVERAEFETALARAATEPRPAATDDLWQGPAGPDAESGRESGDATGQGGGERRGGDRSERDGRTPGAG